MTKRKDDNDLTAAIREALDEGGDLEMLVEERERILNAASPQNLCLLLAAERLEGLDDPAAWAMAAMLRSIEKRMLVFQAGVKADPGSVN